MYTGEEIEIEEGWETLLNTTFKKLYQLNIPMGRLKTGTPPRIKLSSINIDQMEEQPERDQHHGCLYTTDQNIKNNFLVLSQGQTKSLMKL